jgi:hypothetical protein
MTTFITSLTLSTYKLGAYTMHKATETIETINSSTETGIVGIGRTESEAIENYEQNKASGSNCYEHLAFA